MISAELPERGHDKHGSGAFGAPRGSRTHNGIDYACYKGSVIKSVCDGFVTKIGYPYKPNDPKKGHLRYIEITDKNDFKHRYFYVDPLMANGDIVFIGQDIGVSQGLEDIYPGIRDHIHYEIMKGDEYFDPTNFA